MYIYSKCGCVCVCVYVVIYRGGYKTVYSLYIMHVCVCVHVCVMWSVCWHFVFLEMRLSALGVITRTSFFFSVLNLLLTATCSQISPQHPHSERTKDLTVQAYQKYALTFEKISEMGMSQRLGLLKLMSNNGPLI